MSKSPPTRGALGDADTGHAKTRRASAGPRVWPLLSAAPFVASCHDVTRFTTDNGETYQGTVVEASFVRAGIETGTRMCVTLDADHLQDAPGAISTSDGRFVNAPMKPIPQLWHDPLSTFSFGEGRLKNLLYVVTTNGADAGTQADSMFVVSLMQTDQIEVRILRGAPGDTRTDDNLFAIFPLARTKDPCFSQP